jgi:lipopolysaccharide transport system ATP-binding protein
MSAAIEVSGLGKRFRRYLADRPHTLQELLARGFTRVRSRELFWALRDVSFSVARGRAVGIIGTNGSGKSTLLRLVGGIGRADAGSINVAGRIGALLDLGSGFHPDLSGRENVLVAGVLNGLTREELLRRFDEIVAFAEVGDFIDNPMRTYSSGMQMRLAFSAAVHTDPDVLLIDEVLAVGDGAFQRKCLARISRFKESGCALLLVSHGMGVVQEICDEALWLDAGRLMAHGAVPEVVREYTTYLRRAAMPQVAARAMSPADPVSVSTTLAIDGVAILDGDRPVDVLATGQRLRLDIRFHGTAPAPLFRVRVTREDGLVCFDLRTEQSVVAPRLDQPEGRVALVIDRVDLNSGRYRVDVWAYARDWIRVDDHWVSYLAILGDGLREAALNAPHRWEPGGPALAAPAVPSGPAATVAR